jgi:plastocyanin
MENKPKKIISHFHTYGMTVCLLMFLSCNNDAPLPPDVPNNGIQNAIQEINMQNTSFNPAQVTITKGTTVRWINKDAIPHTATSDQPLFDSGNIPSNATYEFKFDTTGTFNYHCNYHLPYMTGQIVVQ